MPTNSHQCSTHTHTHIQACIYTQARTHVLPTHPRTHALMPRARTRECVHAYMASFQRLSVTATAPP